VNKNNNCWLLRCNEQPTCFQNATRAPDPRDRGEESAFFPKKFRRGAYTALPRVVSPFHALHNTARKDFLLRGGKENHLMHKKVLAGIVAVVVLTGLYFGVTMYASNMAAKQVDITIAKMGPGISATYKNVSYNILNKHVAIDDVVIMAPGAPQPLRIMQILVKSLDQTSPTPAFMAMDFKGIVIDLKGLGEEAAAVTELGYADTLSCDLGIDYVYARDKKDLDLKKLSVTVKDAGTLNLSLRLGNIDIDPNQTVALLFTYPRVLLQQASLTYQDDSLMDRLLKAEAKKTGCDVAAVKQKLTGDADAALSGQNNELLAATLTAVKKFINNPKELSISATPATPVPLGKIDEAATPDAVSRMLNLQIKS
jgi:hypothetical protein